ncbi:MAG: T9SS type A sorting domain-containing protein [Bacteroidota bacterium]
MKKISLTIVYSIIFYSLFSQDYSVYINPIAEECGSFEGNYNYTYTDSSLIISGYTITNSCAIPQTTISVDKSSQYPEILISFTDTSEYLCDCNSPRTCKFEIFDVFDTVSISTLGSAYFVDTLMSREMSTKEPCIEPDTMYSKTTEIISYPATVNDIERTNKLNDEHKKFNSLSYLYIITQKSGSYNPGECYITIDTTTILFEAVSDFSPKTKLKNETHPADSTICTRNSTYTFVVWDSIFMSSPIWYSDSLLNNYLHEGNTLTIQPDSTGEYSLFAVREYNDSSYITKVTYSVTEPTPTTNIHETKSNNIRIYPNPAKDYVYIESSEKIEHITIINNGTIIRSCSNSSTLSIQDLPVGIYTLHIFTEKSIYSEMIIKQ